MDESSPKKIGRPTKYESWMGERAIELMTQGYSKEAVAGDLGIAKQTLYDWVKLHDEFSDAIIIGEGKSRMFWERVGIDNIVNKSEYDSQTKVSTSTSLNGFVWNFNMRNRFGWRDQPVDDTPKKPVRLTYNLEISEGESDVE